MTTNPENYMERAAIVVEKEWDIEIDADKRRLGLRLAELISYRDLLWLLVQRDFISFYKQTLLGPLWFFLQPLLTTLMFTLVFGRMGGFSTDGLPGPLFYMAGVTSWNYFADCLSKTSTVFKDNAGIFGKVYFPRLIVPLSIVVSSLVKFGVQLLLLVVFILFYAYNGARFQPTWVIFLFPFVILLMAMLGLGGGMIISAMTTKYRDLAFLLSFGIQLMMYATTVIYPLSAVSKKYEWIIQANPMTALIETFRYGFLGKGMMSWGFLAYSGCFSLLLLFFGALVFNKVERDFVDSI